MSRTEKVIRKGKRLSITEALPDDPIYNRGFVVGGTNFNSSSKEDEGILGSTLKVEISHEWVTSQGPEAVGRESPSGSPCRWEQRFVIGHIPDFVGSYRPVAVKHNLDYRNVSGSPIGFALPCTQFIQP